MNKYLLLCLLVSTSMVCFTMEQPSNNDILQDKESMSSDQAREVLEKIFARKVAKNSSLSVALLHAIKNGQDVEVCIMQ